VVESCWLTSADAGRDDAEDGGDEYDSSDIIFAGVYFLPLIVRMRTTTTTTCGSRTVKQNRLYKRR
jgi:hypothetical protein